MNSIYIPGYGKIPAKDEYRFTNWESPSNQDSLAILSDDDKFHVGSYDEQASKFVCRKCGGDTFNVGHSGYFTAIRCVNCKWEMSVHEG